VGPEQVGRSQHHGNEKSASCAIHCAPGLIHTASILLMKVDAGVPLLNLHQAGADAAGAQIPGSSAKTPICDFRSANELTIGHIHLGRPLDLIECGPAAEEVQSLTTTSRSILSLGLRWRRGDPSAERFSQESR